jgi:hypothetical protein
MQFDGFGHCTASRELDVAPAGFGLAWAVHRLPSQRWMSASCPPAVSCVPTATHAFGAGHDTAARFPWRTLLAVGTIVHRDADAAPAGVKLATPRIDATAQSTAATRFVVIRRARRG